MHIGSIRSIQGTSLYSPYAGRHIQTRGVVTSIFRKGFYIQTLGKTWDRKGSDAIFVFCLEEKPPLGSEVEVSGECVNYLKHESARPVTQIRLDTFNILGTQVSDASANIIPVDLTYDLLPKDNTQLAKLLNSLEGMLVRLPKGSTFIAASNHFGDYVLAYPEHFLEDNMLRSPEGGILPSPKNPQRWFPGFRIYQKRQAKRLNIGAQLKTDIVGPLHYRVDAYQVAAQSGFECEPNDIDLKKSSLTPSDGALTVMTLNGFNLDAHIEDPKYVKNTRQDVDDDWGDGRFHTLGQAIALLANNPDIVALQEIQDNDGAEITDVTDASRTYEHLIQTVEKLSGMRYKWIDINPEQGADGGQPGGNIRNGFLYNPKRVELVSAATRVLGQDLACFVGSRKPLICEFQERVSGESLTIINVHLASKRHQESIFAPANPGIDNKLAVRIAQAETVRAELMSLIEQEKAYYVTGDFNDGEHSEPLHHLIGEESENLVFLLPPEQRYDYNHRGKLQVLMHGIVPKAFVEQNKALYEIVHGNELIGVTPWAKTDKPSDHAYVMAKLMLK